ncbi:MAG: DUF4837 family protein [Bacteroidia bacterium]|nr:DUF4837 family protein [Bacteroidia bacterium]
MRYLLIICTVIFVYGCKKKTLPEATGTVGDLVIFTDDQTNSETSKTITELLGSAVPYLTDNEPWFNIEKPNPEQFEESFKTKKNVLVLVTESNSEILGSALDGFNKDSIKILINNSASAPVFKRDIFAKHQVVGYIFGKDSKDISRKIAENRQSLFDMLSAMTLKTENENLFSDTSSNSVYFKKFKVEFGVGVSIPKDYKLMKSGNGFYWFQKDVKNAEQGDRTIGLIVHGYFSSDSSFSEKDIVRMRDSFNRINIPFGEVPGTYVSTSNSSRFPARTLQLLPSNDGSRNLMLRGWWSVKGATDVYGPFVRYIRENAINKSVFAFEGFVYKPGKNAKLSDLREIEAIALSIK